MERISHSRNTMLCRRSIPDRLNPHSFRRFRRSSSNRLSAFFNVAISSAVTSNSILYFMPPIFAPSRGQPLSNQSNVAVIGRFPPRAKPSAHALRAPRRRAVVVWALSGGAFAATRARIGRLTRSNVSIPIGPLLVCQRATARTSGRQRQNSPLTRLVNGFSNKLENFKVTGSLNSRSITS
jgi:hypothetical protein